MKSKSFFLIRRNLFIKINRHKITQNNKTKIKLNKNKTLTKTNPKIQQKTKIIKAKTPLLLLFQTTTTNNHPKLTTTPN